MKKFSLLLASVFFLGGAAMAQSHHCETDEVNNRLKAQNPQIAVIEAQLENEIQQRIARGSFNRFGKGTAVNTDTILHIPVVFHVIHDYGEEYVSDDQIFGVIADMNQMYSRTNPDSVGTIPTYSGNIPGTNIKYRGKANIQFHLATKDPQGNPTHGITRRRSYMSTNGGDNSKLDLWAPDSYLNIWLIHNFSGAHTGAAAYAYIPASAAGNPYGDGVITIVQPTTGNGLNTDHTISHEVGHVFDLQHPFGSTNSPQIACGDDGVDDTPPTKGHYQPGGCIPVNLYDTVCAKGYSKTYTPSQSMALFGDATHLFIDYPDTVNSQNVMDYTYCSKMFTYGQVLRMRAALNSSVAGRSNLISASNLASTGALDTWPDLTPTADFSTNLPFICADGIASVTLTNRSWNDTLSASSWTIDHGASTGTASTTNVATTFSQPGWVNISLTATGNNGSGSNTTTKNDLVYAADPNAINPVGYTQSFGDATDNSMWPIFNYYGTDHKWEIVSTAGVDNNNSIRFANFDPRPYSYPGNITGTPGGVYADFYSRAFDLTNATSATKLSYAFAGAYRTTSGSEMNDKLVVYISNSCGLTWTRLDSITNANVGNNGYVGTNFTPNSYQWSNHSVAIPPFMLGDKVFLRFRFTSGTDNIYSLFGTGNNFYLDRIAINDYPLGIDPAQLAAQGIIISPNPTSGNATLTINGGIGAAQVHVADITGKLVYSTEATLKTTATQVNIPAERISVKGMYLVEVITNGKTMTQKLVVY